MEGFVSAFDERKELCRNMPSELLKPGKRGCWGYPRSAFCDSPASVDRKSESTNSIEAVDKDYGEQWEIPGEVSPPQNSNCSDKMSVGFRPGEMSPELDMYSDGGTLSESGRITPRDNLEKCFNCRPGEPFLEDESSNVHSASFGTPVNEEPPSSSPNFTPAEGHVRYLHKIRRKNLLDNESSPKMLINPNLSALNDFERAKWKPGTHQLIFNRIGRAAWNSPLRSQNPCSRLYHHNIRNCQDDGGKYQRVSTCKKMEELLSSWEVFLHQLKNYEQTPTDFVKAIEAHLQLTKLEVGRHANDTVVAPKEGSNIVQDKFQNREPLKNVIEPRLKKIDSSFLKSGQLNRSDPKAEYCSDKEIGQWPKSVKHPTYEISYEVYKQEDDLESVIPFQAPSIENSDLPIVAVPSGESSEMKFNDSEEVNFTNGVVQLAMEDKSQNVNDVNKAETFSEQVDPREDLALRSQDTRESIIKETNESLTTVFRSPVENLCPVESSELKQVNTGSNYYLSADPLYSGKRLLPHRADESEVQNNGNQDVGNSQAGMSSCNESPMFINPNRNEYYTSPINAEALPKQLKSKALEHNSVAVEPCEVTFRQSTKCSSEEKSVTNYTSQKSKYSAYRERPVREALLAAECNLPITASLISETLKVNQNPPPFNPDCVKSQDVKETGHYKYRSDYKYQPEYEHPSSYQARDPRCYQPYSYPSRESGPHGMYERRSFETYQSYLPSVYENRGCRRLSLPYPEPYQQSFHPLYPFPHLN